MANLMEKYGGIVYSVLTLLVLALGFWVYSIISAQSDTMKDKAGQQSAVLKSTEFDMYNNKNVLGSEVLNAATAFQFKPQFAVKIVTGGSTAAGFFALNESIAPSGTCYATPATGYQVAAPTVCATSTMTSVAAMKDTTSLTTYVNLTASFRARVFTDSTGEARLIEFVQQ
jgi:hypothetical protein